MGGTVLGKRTRGLALNGKSFLGNFPSSSRGYWHSPALFPDPELPAKRARGSRENDLVKEGKGKSARAIAIQPPDAFEDQENRNPIVECADLPVAAPPSRRRTKQALAAVTSKQRKCDRPEVSVSISSHINAQPTTQSRRKLLVTMMSSRRRAQHPGIGLCPQGSSPGDLHLKHP